MRADARYSIMPNSSDPENAAVSAADYADPGCFRVEAQDHSFTFYPQGQERLEALIEQIDSAQKSLNIFYYMFQDDETGTRVRDAIAEAAKRGVQVRLIIDDLGSDAPDKFFEPITQAGGEFAKFSARWGVRYLIRNHQKFVIVDGERVFTGGANVSDHYYAPVEDNGWCDLSVTIEGEIVGKFVRWFALLRKWVETEGSQLRRLRNMVKNWDGGDGPVRLLVGGPLVRHGNWVRQFRRDVSNAERLDTVSAYFTPPRSMRQQFARLARRGTYRMIAAGKSDIDATIDVARLHYKKLLRAGAKIYEFQCCKLHMKLLIVDDICYFGSANLDKRSIRINVELMVRVEDAGLAKRLRELVDHLEDASQPVTDEWYAEKSTWWNRARWRLYYWISLADYRTSLKLNQ